MGVNLKDLLVKETIGFDELKGKVVTVDSFNMLYQFLTTIRTPDGKPLTDSKGNVTSHLIGLFNRTTKFMAKGIKPVFVFDIIFGEIKIMRRIKAIIVRNLFTFLRFIIDFFNF